MAAGRNEASRDVAGPFNRQHRCLLVSKDKLCALLSRSLDLRWGSPDATGSPHTLGLPSRTLTVGYTTTDKPVPDEPISPSDHRGGTVRYTTQVPTDKPTNVTRGDRRMC